MKTARCSYCHASFTPRGKEAICPRCGKPVTGEELPIQARVKPKAEIGDELSDLEPSGAASIPSSPAEERGQKTELVPKGAGTDLLGGDETLFEPTSPRPGGGDNSSSPTSAPQTGKSVTKTPDFFSAGEGAVDRHPLSDLEPSFGDNVRPVGGAPVSGRTEISAEALPDTGQDALSDLDDFTTAPRETTDEGPSKPLAVISLVKGRRDNAQAESPSEPSPATREVPPRMDLPAAETKTSDLTSSRALWLRAARTFGPTLAVCALFLVWVIADVRHHKAPAQPPPAPSSVDPNEEAHNRLVVRAIEAFSIGDQDQALKLVNQALALKPDAPVALSLKQWLVDIQRANENR